MGAISDMHIGICEEIENVMCEELGMEKCQRTYELAVLIFDSILKMTEGLDTSNTVI